ATISGTYSGVTKTASLTVNPPPAPPAAALSSLTLNPTSVVGGSPSTGTVTLTAAAPAGGVTVSLSSSKTTVATVPSSVLVPQGATSKTFTVTTLRVTKNTSAVISASYSGVTKTATLTARRK